MLKKCTLSITNIGSVIIPRSELRIDENYDFEPHEDRKEFPASCIELSNGTRLASLEKPFVLHRRKGRGRWRYQQVINNSDQANWHYTANALSHLSYCDLNGFTTEVHFPIDAKIGEELAWEYAFQKVRPWRNIDWPFLSNGDLSIPIERAGKGEHHTLNRKWREGTPNWIHKILKISKSSWADLIDVVQGRYAEEVFNIAEWLRADFNPKEWFKNLQNQK